MTDPTFAQLFLRQLLTGLGVTVGLGGCCLEQTDTICIDADTAESCPDPEQVRQEEGAESADAAVFFPERRYVFDGEAYVEPSTCCYEVSHGVQCDAPSGMGRPFLAAGSSLRARTRPDVNGHWASALSVGSVDVERAQRWRERACMEHAAVASLGRFALELMALGAEPDLVAAAHRAAADEVAHARLAFGLARAFGGAAVAPTAFPFPEAQVPLARDRVELAVRTVHEGAIEETLGVFALSEEHATCTDPVERRVLGAILRDERRHALLAWRTLRWAIETGGAPVRSAVREAFARGRAAVVKTPDMERAWREVMEPCIAAC